MTTKRILPRLAPALAYIDIPEDNDRIANDKINLNERKFFPSLSNLAKLL